MNNSKLDSYTLQCPEKEKLRLQEWRHVSNVRVVMYGAVVRTKIEELWEDEYTVSMIGERYIYGIISNQEEYDKASTLRAWAVN